MPHVLDRAKQITNELRTTETFGGELELIDTANGSTLAADFLPELEKVVDLPGLQALNEKMRKKIDATP